MGAVDRRSSTDSVLLSLSEPVLSLAKWHFRLVSLPLRVNGRRFPGKSIAGVYILDWPLASVVEGYIACGDGCDEHDRISETIHQENLRVL